MFATESPHSLPEMTGFSNYNGNHRPTTERRLIVRQNLDYKIDTALIMDHAKLTKTNPALDNGTMKPNTLRYAANDNIHVDGT